MIISGTIVMIMNFNFMIMLESAESESAAGIPLDGV
jgi:hypothetical protein